MRRLHARRSHTHPDALTTGVRSCKVAIVRGGARASGACRARLAGRLSSSRERAFTTTTRIARATSLAHTPLAARIRAARTLAARARAAPVVLCQQRASSCLHCRSRARRVAVRRPCSAPRSTLTNVGMRASESGQARERRRRRRRRSARGGSRRGELALHAARQRRASRPTVYLYVWKTTATGRRPKAEFRPKLFQTTRHTFVKNDSKTLVVDKME